jgi:hypothetical protein
MAVENIGRGLSDEQLNQFKRPSNARVLGRGHNLGEVSGTGVKARVGGAQCIAHGATDLVEAAGRTWSTVHPKTDRYVKMRGVVKKRDARFCMYRK